jgi:hypothetical protein
MCRGRAHFLAGSLATVALPLLVSAPAAAETDRCSTEASVSPCFDADPLWMPTRPTPFVAVRSARAVRAHELALGLGADVSHRPVVLVVPSPHPEGQEIDAVETTSTVTLGARYGLGYGLDAGLALPFVPYQVGAGAQALTDQGGDGLTPVTLRDPRLELGATLLGGSASDVLTLGSELDVSLPLGGSSALAGAAGPSVAPAFEADLALAPVRIGLDAGLRLTRAVALGSVREGSAAYLALGVSVALLRDPGLSLGVEAWLRPSLTGRAAGAPADTRDLPAEWLASARLEPTAAWSVLLGGGSGLPLSSARDPGRPRSAVLGVTSPEFRAVLVARYTLSPLF